MVDEVIGRRFDHLRKLEGFHCDEQWTSWLQPYKKYTVFHEFIEFIVQGVHAEQADAVDMDERKAAMAAYEDIPAAIEDLKPDKLPIELAFDRYDIEHQSFVEYLSEAGRRFNEADADDVYEFMNETRSSEPYEKLLHQTVIEIFHVLFQNRGLLLAFNEYVSGILADVDMDKVEDIDQSRLAQNGRLRRVRPPIWARRAVFFRDRGRCVLCDTDLSSLINLDNVENYDHIVPISQFGLNDVSNLQLLCVACNQREKRGGFAVTSSRYQSWYRYDRTRG
ncbi:MAG: HNH endonuclease [Pseudomonadota bacterium]